MVLHSSFTVPQQCRCSLPTRQFEYLVFKETCPKCLRRQFWYTPLCVSHGVGIQGDTSLNVPCLRCRDDDGIDTTICLKVYIIESGGGLFGGMFSYEATCLTTDPVNGTTRLPCRPYWTTRTLRISSDFSGLIQTIRGDTLVGTALEEFRDALSGPGLSCHAAYTMVWAEAWS